MWSLIITAIETDLIFVWFWQIFTSIKGHQVSEDALGLWRGAEWDSTGKHHHHNNIHTHTYVYMYVHICASGVYCGSWLICRCDKLSSVLLHHWQNVTLIQSILYFYNIYPTTPRLHHSYFVMSFLRLESHHLGQCSRFSRNNVSGPCVSLGAGGWFCCSF